MNLLERTLGPLAKPITAWRQSRHAKAVSHELLNLHRFVAERHPNLRGRPLYRQIVMLRSRADMATADRLLRCAEESFAAWPTQRDLKFADVVHYLAIEEFLAAHPETSWTQTHMGRIVTARIPRRL
jgi:hypothetical protein